MAPLTPSSDAQLPDGIDGPDAHELVYRNYHTLVTRRMAGSGLQLVCKQAIGPRALRRLRNERAILERLADVDGVVKLAPVSGTADTLLLRDDDGVPLADMLATGPAEIAEAVRIGHGLCAVLAGVHQAGVVHRDLNPSNVLLAGPARRPLLIDFNIATRAGNDGVDVSLPGQIEGTPAYMAPEQTGRTGRPVDHRCDLYALGVVMYELLTGCRPFSVGDSGDDSGGDLLDLVHAHLTVLPPTPNELRADVPRLLSDFVMRLLEKEPDRRYQSAGGAAHDLARIGYSVAQRDEPSFVLGERDFAWRLAPPARPIGRDHEIWTLGEALERCLEGGADGTPGPGGAAFVTGDAGVGKSTLVNELRAAVAVRRGWFIAARFDTTRLDATRRNTPAAAVQVLRGLGQLLLSEPDEQLARHRAALVTALGALGAIAAAASPEMAVVLRDGADVATAGAAEDVKNIDRRLTQAALRALGALAERDHPVVLALDDLQGACADSLGFVEAVLAARLPAVLAVASWRPGESAAVDAAAERWQTPDALVLQLPNLGRAQVAELAAQMMRLSPRRADELAQLLVARTAGNPQDTIELVNALRRDGLLSPVESGWEWEAGAVRRHVSDSVRGDVLKGRIEALPASCLELLEILARLGAEAGSSLLCAASGLDEDALREALAPAVEDGLLLVRPRDGEEDHLLRNARVREALRERLDASPTMLTALVLARRLSVHRPHREAAARLYLDALEQIHERAERRRAAQLMRDAAASCRYSAPALGQRLLQAALQLLLPIEQLGDAPLLLSLHEAHHASLYSLNRFDEADAAYDALVVRCDEPRELSTALGMQVMSLTQRGQAARALESGLALLARLGIARPADLKAAIGQGIQRICAWVLGDDKEADLQRPELSDPDRVAQAHLMARLLNASFQVDRPVYAWLALEQHRLWAESGPSPALVAALSGLPTLMISVARQYRAAHTLGRHLLRVSEARRYGSKSAMPRLLYGCWGSHWCEPLEQALVETRRGRDEMARAGEAQYSSFAYAITCLQVFDTAPLLEDTLDEVNAGLAVSAGVRNINDPLNVLYRQLVRAMQGETHAPGSFNEDGFDEVAHLGQGLASTTTRPTFRVLRSISASIYNDPQTLAKIVDETLPTLFNDEGFYAGSLAHVFAAMSSAQRLRDAGAGTEAGQPHLKVLTRISGWLAQRAEEAPANYLHLLHLVDAERLWAEGEIVAAGQAYERAMAGAAKRHRPWHGAWITERAARFWLAHGFERAGRWLIAEAARLYNDWGASGKVRVLLEEFTFLRITAKDRRSVTAASLATAAGHDPVDLVATLQASQAISSETSLVRLNERVVKVIGAMTGATTVLLVVRSPDMPGWTLASSLGSSLASGGEPVTVEQAAANHELALSAFHYAARTREPLLLEDARRDDRFSADPSLGDTAHCALLHVPLQSQGELRTMLVLENRQRPGAFTADRLDALRLIAGQLSVSLDNALLYASLERKVTERTQALEAANQQLERLSATDALTGLANRRRFSEALDAEWVRARRTGGQVGIALIDVDQFKAYNDHYGHLGGDACLQLVSQAMAGAVRLGVDLVARYGGEEFVLLLPDTDLVGVYAVAERVRLAVEARQSPHPASTHGIVTVSIGIVAGLPAPNVRPNDLLALADAALYEAKRAGRNRIELPMGEDPIDGGPETTY
jgi:diguanylate cyclase (GGDEF)-like protein